MSATAPTTPWAPAPAPRRTLAFRSPRLRSDLSAIPDSSDRVIFVGEHRRFYVQGPLVQQLVALLDGNRDVREICRAMLPHAMPLVLRELMRLQGLGALAEGAVDGGAARPDDAEREFLDAAGAQTGPHVTLIGPAAGPLAHALAIGGEEPAIVAGPGDAPAGALLIAAVDDYLDPELEAINTWALTTGRPWMLCRPAGVVPWIGPLLIPGITACWSCLAYRLRVNRSLDEYLRMTQGRETPAFVPHAATSASVGAAHALIAAAAAQLGEDPAAGRLAGRLVTLDLFAAATEDHPVTRRPQCPDCGDPVEFAVPRRPMIRPRPKLGDGHRVRTAAEVLDTLAPQVSPFTGAVTSVSPVDTGTDLFAACAAGHPYAISRTRFDQMTRLLRGSLSGGKGRNPDQARVSAVCEAVERGSALWRGDEAQTLASCNELGSEALDTRALFQFSDDQYARGDEINATSESRYEFVARPLEADQPIDWVRAWDPGSDRSVLVPSAYCFFGHPDMYRHWFYVCDSNGLASGGCIEEAITSGFYEVIERDSVALWWYNRASRPVVDLDSFGDPYLDQLRAYYTAVGRELWVIDITTDTQVPAFAAVSRRIDHPVEDLLVGFGCHLDPRAAMASAVDELNQFLPMVAGRKADNSTLYWGMDGEAERWCRRASVATEPYFQPAAGMPTRRLGDFTDWSTRDAASDVAACRERARSLGMDLWAVDLSRPDVDLSVAKVIVPGMRHFWRRLAPGRLYDAPVEMGWIDRPLAESGLNPETVYF